MKHANCWNPQYYIWAKKLVTTTVALSCTVIFAIQHFWRKSSTLSSITAMINIQWLKKYFQKIKLILETTLIWMVQKLQQMFQSNNHWNKNKPFGGQYCVIVCWFANIIVQYIIDLNDAIEIFSGCWIDFDIETWEYKKLCCCPLI